MRRGSKQSVKQSVLEMIDLRDNGGELNGEGPGTHAAYDMIMECPNEESVMDVIKSRKAKKRAKYGLERKRCRWGR
jgi:hypothetical protein